MPAPLPKAPPPHIFPGLGQADAAQAARSWHSMRGVAYRAVSPPSAPTSSGTVSSGDRHGGVQAGPPQPPAPSGAPLLAALGAAASVAVPGGGGGAVLAHTIG
eukprot:7417936-Alexandrium_andersonii.AAC.1